MYSARFPAFRAVPVAVATGVVAFAVVTTACGSTASGGSHTATRMAGTGQASAPVSAKATGSAPAGSVAASSPAPGSVAASTPAASSAAGGTSAASPAGTAKLSGSAASALATTALTNTKDAVSVRVTGNAVSTGSGSQAVSFDLTLVKNTGCQGTIALSKTETFRIIETGGYVWLLPTTSFYTTLHLNKAALALVADKYIRVKSTDSQIGDLAKICSFSGLFGALPKTTGAGYVATPVSYQGRPAYQLTQTGTAGEAFISDTAKPLMLKLSETGPNGGAITFTDYNLVKSITPPTAAESIDGTQLGI